jgi:esterase/lipase superfamily enzyme
VGDFRDLFDGYYDEDIYFHMPAHFLANIRDESLVHNLQRLHVTLAVGDADPFIDSNRQIDDLLGGLHIPRHLHVWPGRAHKPRHWQAMTQQYL